MNIYLNRFQFSLLIIPCPSEIRLKLTNITVMSVMERADGSPVLNPEESAQTAREGGRLSQYDPLFTSLIIPNIVSQYLILKQF